MPNGLPEFLDLARLTRQPLELAGRVRMKAMPRLNAILSGAAGDPALVLHAVDEGNGRVSVRGGIEAELPLTCQRCLEPMTQPVSAEFRLIWVRSDSEAAALETEEPLLSPDGRVNLAELVEDELLLAAPSVPMHENARCKASKQEKVPQTGELKSKIGQTQNPFAVLEQLKRHR